eukprot:353989-Rhodomonas_salina.2
MLSPSLYPHTRSSVLLARGPNNQHSIHSRESNTQLTQHLIHSPSLTAYIPKSNPMNHIPGTNCTEIVVPCI